MKPKLGFLKRGTGKSDMFNPAERSLNPIVDETKTGIRLTPLNCVTEKKGGSGSLGPPRSRTDNWRFNVARQIYAADAEMTSLL